MQQYYDLEINILSCLLQRPELMKELIIEDKHFTKHKKLFIFFKSCYNKFETLDINLMYSICKEKYKFFEQICFLIDVCPSPSLFNLYQQQLIDLYNEKKKEKYIIDRVFSIANDLYVRNITLDEFEKQYNKIKSEAVKIFKEE